ncbi:hypothetical protein QT970_29450 [Microcoleus sp. herbarium8]
MNVIARVGQATPERSTRIKRIERNPGLHPQAVAISDSGFSVNQALD